MRFGYVIKLRGHYVTRRGTLVKDIADAEFWRTRELAERAIRIEVQLKQANYDGAEIIEVNGPSK